jgi:hypothetical protein
MAVRIEAHGAQMPGHMKWIAEVASCAQRHDSPVPPFIQCFADTP